MCLVTLIVKPSRPPRPKCSTCTMVGELTSCNIWRKQYLRASHQDRKQMLIANHKNPLRFMVSCALVIWHKWDILLWVVLCRTQKSAQETFSIRSEQHQQPLILSEHELPTTGSCQIYFHKPSFHIFFQAYFFPR